MRGNDDDEPDQGVANALCDR